MKQESSVDVLLADIMLRLTALEKMLINKKVINQDEYVQELESLAKNVAKIVLEKANNSKDISELIVNLEKGN